MVFNRLSFAIEMVQFTETRQEMSLLMMKPCTVVRQIDRQTEG